MCAGNSERAALADRVSERVASEAADGARRAAHGPGLHARRHRGPHQIFVSMPHFDSLLIKYIIIACIITHFRHDFTLYMLRFLFLTLYMHTYFASSTFTFIYKILDHV